MFSDDNDLLKKLDTKEQFLQFVSEMGDETAALDMSEIKAEAAQDIEQVRKWDVVLAQKMQDIVNALEAVHEYAKTRTEPAGSSNG